MNTRFKRKLLLNIVCAALVIITSAACLCGTESSFAAQEQVQPEMAADELIVICQPGKADAEQQIEDLLSKKTPVESAKTVADTVGEEGPGVLVKLEEAEDLATARKLLTRQPDVAYVQPNFRYRMMDAPADTYWSEAYQLSPWDSSFQKSCGANVTGAWELMGGFRSLDQATAAPVLIAVLDSGCQVTHEDLLDMVDTEHAYNAVTRMEGIENIADGSSHGTHVCGIAAGATDNGIGIAGASGNYARILPINVFEGQWADTAHLVTAYSYLEELMDKGELPGLHVINMSLGGYGDPDENDVALEQYIIRMRQKDVLTVCAGGNGDDENGIAYKDKFAYPGDFEACMCVTSLDSNGTNSSFSDYSMEKDISAPGSFILSTMTDEKGTLGEESDGKYGYLSGTSMASPLVAGIAALIWADNDQLSADQVYESIIRSAVPVNPAVFSHEGETGSAGAIDAAGAVQYAREHFDDQRKNLKDAEIQPESAGFIYDGTEKRPAIQVIYDGAVLKEKEDYIVSYWNDILAGTATYTVTGIREYIGSVTGQYDIAPADLADCEVTMDPPAFAYDGQSHFPKLKVVMGLQTLKWGKDFTVTASTDGIKAGTHPIRLDGKGNYTGTRLISYEITPEEQSGGDPPADPPGGSSMGPSEPAADSGSVPDAGPGSQGGTEPGEGDDPGMQPGQTEEPGTQNAEIRIGDEVSFENAVYIVTKSVEAQKPGSVSLLRSADETIIILPAFVTLADGKCYRVNGIRPGAFSESRAETLILKTRYLKKMAIRNSLRSSRIKNIRIRIGTRKQNLKCKKRYRRIFRKVNVGKKVLVR